MGLRNSLRLVPGGRRRHYPNNELKPQRSKSLLGGTPTTKEVNKSSSLSKHNHKNTDRRRRRNSLSFLRRSLVRRREPSIITTNSQTSGKEDPATSPSEKSSGSAKEEKTNVSGNCSSISKKFAEPLVKSSTQSLTSTSTKIIRSSTTTPVTTTKRPSLQFLRRLSSPIILQRFSSDRDSRGSSKDTEESHGCHSNSDDDQHQQKGQKLMERTTIVPETYSPPRRRRGRKNQPPPPTTSPVSEAIDEGEAHHHNDVDVDAVTRFECATAILQHSYLERICGVGNGNTNSFDNYYVDLNQTQHHLSEDPTVQESIECIFASQLQDGLMLWDDDDDDASSTEIEQISQRRNDLISPTDIQQSRMNRNDRKNSISFNLKETKKRYEQASLVYVGTYDPSIPHEEIATNNDSSRKLDTHPDPLPCRCATSFLPAIEPKDWPQAPVMLRPTPGSSTRVKAVRFCNSDEPLWVPGSHLSWPDRLARIWNKAGEEQAHFACCEGCAVLPINNGNEEPGHSLVIDFESDLFEGSLLLRLRFTEGTTPEPYDDNKGYFNGVNRRYQACIRGKFKKSIPFTEMVTGFRFERKCGKLPAKWILRGSLKVLSFFAPQLDAKLEGDRPHSLTPLGSTPQSVAVDDPDNLCSMEDDQVEPAEAHRTLVGESSAAPSSVQRAKQRKKAFDKLFVQRSVEPLTDPSKVYTFEFLQHLFNFQNFSIELGNMLGSVELEDVLDGQPLQIMAAYGDEPIWAFDVWHECLWEQAKAFDEKCRGK